jgi:ABC-2 type transport system ATP-binding protein/lipopolysaccharide transport system ATP-binding protein
MTSIRIQNVSVQLPIYDSTTLRLIRMPTFGLANVGTRNVSQTSAAVIIHALTDINVEFNDGDRVCLIGHNGAGKTTLLRLIAGIYPPTAGRVEVTGKIIAQLGNSMSLNGDATGYENVRLVAELYGWPQENLQDFIRDVEEFTDLGEYLSLPTRVYSAGMAARLTFALVTMQAPDILLIDEGIGAGDAQFQKRAELRVKRFLGQAKIIVLASHSVELCRAICNKALLMANGRQEFFGDIDEGFDRYAKLR